MTALSPESAIQDVDLVYLNKLTRTLEQQCAFTVTSINHQSLSEYLYTCRVAYLPLKC
jgi:hypothetical protein